MSKESDACFDIPLREAVASLARRNTTRSTDADEQAEGSSDRSDGDAHHTSIDIPANFGVEVLPLLGESESQFLQQDYGIFAEEIIGRYHKRRKVLGRCC